MVLHTEMFSAKRGTMLSRMCGTIRRTLSKYCRKETQLNFYWMMAVPALLCVNMGIRQSEPNRNVLAVCEALG